MQEKVGGIELNLIMAADKVSCGTPTDKAMCSEQSVSEADLQLPELLSLKGVN